MVLLGLALFLLGGLALGAFLLAAPPDEPVAVSPPDPIVAPERREVIFRVQPRYPEGAQGDHRCTVGVEVDAGGVPVSTRVEGCPEAFVAATESAVSSWRWKPKTEGGTPVPFTTELAVTYKQVP